MCDQVHRSPIHLDFMHSTNTKDKFRRPVLDLTLEADRLTTFNHWNNNYVTPESLAKAGFFSKYSTDVVTCAFCGVEIGNWEEGDEPFEDHRKWSPTCRFITEQTTAEIARSFRSLSGQDVCGTTEYFPNSFPENETCKLLFKTMIKSYEDFKSRLETFTDWPKSLKQKPIVLAEAGFYYKGAGDQTVCFECNGGLKDWEDNDDPWEQHALWFPTCKFLLNTKGQDFIDHIKQKFKPDSKQHAEPTKEECSKSALSGTSGSRGSGQNGDRSTECKICFDNNAEVVFLPCGHYLSCLQCSTSLKSTCPYCRKKFDAAVRIYPA